MLNAARVDEMVAKSVLSAIWRPGQTLLSSLIKLSLYDRYLDSPAAKAKRNRRRIEYGMVNGQHVLRVFH